MNIFKALSEGSGKISETNITSFLSYLLDSTNELNNTFFVLFAKIIDSQLNEYKICDLLNINQRTVREQILHFSENYTVSSEPEYSIKTPDGSQQIPDILLRIISKNTEEDVAYIIIENKIKKLQLKKNKLKSSIITSHNPKIMIKVYLYIQYSYRRMKKYLRIFTKHQK